MEKPARRSVVTLLLLFGGLFLLFFGLVVSAATVAEGGRTESGPAIGVVEIKGIIEDPKVPMRRLRSFAADEDIKGIIVRVDSPGGSVGPSQELFREVLRARESKTVVASLGGVAASGGYYAICGADLIVANPGTLTGSIGVITQIAHFEDVLDLLMVETETYKSGALKDSGSPTREPTPADRELFRGLVENIHEQFRSDIVAQRGERMKKLQEGAMDQVADGRVLSGAQAKELGLVDELGNLHDAADHLAKAAGLKGEPRLVYPDKKTEDLIKELLDRGVGTVIQSVRQRLSGPRIEYRLPQRL